MRTLISVAYSVSMTGRTTRKRQIVKKQMGSRMLTWNQGNQGMRTGKDSRTDKKVMMKDDQAEEVLLI
jgi:hypothetical protein